MRSTPSINPRMMASILCGFGVVEAAGWLARMMQHRLREAAGLAAALAVGLFWLIVSAGNLGIMVYEWPWRQESSILQMAIEISHHPSICGIGFANAKSYNAGGYTFLHQPVPAYFDENDLNRLENFTSVANAYNALVVRRDNLDLFSNVPAYTKYALDQCLEDHCLLIRPGTCVDARPPRPIIGALTATTPLDPLYPYAAGVSP